MASRMTDEAWRIGVVGAGNIADFHLQAWAECPRAYAVAICDPDIDRAKARAVSYGIERVYPSLETMLESENLDALDVLSARGTHEAVVRRAAVAHLPVLCQKPLCDHLEDARKLVDDTREKTRLMINENSRWRPHYRLMSQWLSAGALGEVRQVRDSLLSSGFLPQHPDQTPPDIAAQPSFRTLGRLLVAEALIHQIDVLRALLGPLRLLAARAGRTSDWVCGEDLATLFFESAHGVPVILEGNRSAPGLTAGWAEEFLIMGTLGTARLENYSLARLGPEEEYHDFERRATIQAGFSRAAQHFIECLETGAEFETGPFDNLETLALVEEAYRLAGLA